MNGLPSDFAGRTAEALPSPPPPDAAHRSVHLLVVHGVGRHDRLSNLLRTYQSLRANLTSVEAPVPGEDQVPGWRLAEFDESASPPFLKLQPRVDPQPGSVGAVYLYEVNYAGFAGVIRRNHPIDLTTLFLGFDLAVCAARQRPSDRSTAVLGGDTAQLAACLQRISGVLSVATVPIVGLPSIVFRDYIGTFVATFARFFEDVATFALDKNGEQLISTHFDRTMTSIASGMAAGDRLVVAAHSLGSIVVHIVRGLKGGAIAHRFFGPAKAAVVGRAHTEYFNDKNGFLDILLRAAGLAAGDPESVAGRRSASDHWIATQSVLRRVQWVVLGLAVTAITIYCGLVARRFGEIRTLGIVALFVWPGVTIGVLAFFQRLLRGGPTKRVTTALISELKWFERASFPYRLGRFTRSVLRRSRDVDPMAASPGSLMRLILNVVSFTPTVCAMAIPIAAAAWLTDRWPTPVEVWARIWTLDGLFALACFVTYVICCAVHELIRAWRRVLRIVSSPSNAS